MRREFSAKTKLAAWERSGGKCEGCGVKIYAGNGPEYDHAVRCELGGTNDLDNCRVLCRNCHGAKTYGRDIPEAAKGKRLRSSRAGIDKRKGRPLPGTKASGWKQKISGGWERRNNE